MRTTDMSIAKKYPATMTTPKLYIDGCSYTAGCVDTIGKWNNTYYELDSHHLGGLVNFFQRPGWDTVSAAATAKSNIHILQDFLKHLDYIIDNQLKVLIYWSHSERDLMLFDPYEDAIDESNALFRGGGYMDDKCLGDGLAIDWRDFTDGSKAGKGRWNERKGKFDKQIYEKFLGKHARTISLMIAVQKLCELNNIDYRFLTTDPYVDYQQIPEHKELNKDKIFNWPLPGIKSKLDLDEKELFNAWWSVRPLTLQFARAFGSLNNKNYIHEDHKHLNDEGAHLLVNMIIEWWDKDPAKDLQWYYDNVLNGPAKQYFVDEEAHWKDIIGSDNIGVHWIERNILKHRDKLLAPADFIYED